MGRLSWRLGLGLGFLGTACAGGQSGTEGSPIEDSCHEATTTVVASDESTPIGTPRDLLTSMAAPLETTLRWYTHDEASAFRDTTLTLALDGQLGEATYVVPEAESCPQELRIETTIKFATLDGAFAERFSGTLYRTTGGSTGFTGTLPVTEFKGSYDASSLIQRRIDPYYTLYTTLSPPTGTLSLDGPLEDASPNGVAVSAAVADWPNGSNQP